MKALVAVGTIGTLVCGPLTAHAQSCAPVPQASRDLDIPRFYGDTKGSVVDPNLQRAHDAAVARLTAWLRQVTQDADKAISRPSDKSRGEAARCALDALDAWAREGAYLGVMAQAQAEYQRKWDLAGASLAYLKVRRFATADQRQRIEPWLKAWADAAHAFQTAPGRTRNNHLYWLGLAEFAVGIGTDSATHVDRARVIFDEALGHIDADGFLPAELERGARAAFYHVFAVVPLVLMAELAATRGSDWYALQNGALHRLVARATESLASTERIGARAGVAQEVPVNPRAGWLPLYVLRFPNRLPEPVPQIARQHRWLGGDVSHLVTALTAQRAR